MAIAIDASTPAGASQTSGTTATVQSASFTPPSGSVVLISWAGNTASTAPASTPTISNTGSLTFTQIGWRNEADTSGAGGKEGQCALWYAVVASSPGSMTVTVTTQSASGDRHARVKPVVLTGVDTTNPIASSGEGSDSGSTLDSITWTTTVADSMGFAAVSDWDVNSTTFTAAAGTTVVDSATPGSAINTATLRQTTTTTSGQSITLGLTSPTGTTWNFVWAEMRPGAAGASAAATTAASAVAGGSAKPSLGPPAEVTAASVAGQSATDKVSTTAGGSASSVGAQSAVPALSAAAATPGTGSAALAVTSNVISTSGASGSTVGAQNASVSTGGPVAYDSLFGDTPPTLGGNDDDAPLTVGLGFSTLAPGTIAGARLYTGTTETGAITAVLYDAAGPTVLATKAGPSSTSAGTYDIIFDTPVTADDSKVYVIAIFHPEGRYSFTLNQFSADVTSPGGNIFAGFGGAYGPGRYAYGGSATYPNNTEAHWYGVSPLFLTEAGDATPPAQTAGVGPAAQSAGVSANTNTSSAGATAAAQNAGALTGVLASAGLAGVAPAAQGIGSTVRTTGPTTAGTAAVGQSATVTEGVASEYSSLFVTPPSFGGSDDDNPLTVGTAFSPLIDGAVGGVRVHTATSETGEWTVELWDSSGPSLLATATGPSNPGTGSYDIEFDDPVDIVTTGVYTVTCFHPEGRYSYTLGYFTSDYTSSDGKLFAGLGGAYGPGRYSYGASPTYPIQNEQNWYGVEPLFLSDVVETNVDAGTAGVAPAAFSATAGAATSASAGTGSVGAAALFDSSGGIVSAELESQNPLAVTAAAQSATVTQSSSATAGNAGVSAAAQSAVAGQATSAPAGTSAVAPSALSAGTSGTTTAGTAQVATTAPSPAVSSSNSATINAGTAGVGVSAQSVTSTVGVRATTAGTTASAQPGDSQETGDATANAGAASVLAGAFSVSASAPVFALAETASVIVNALMASGTTTELAPGAFPIFTVIDLANFSGRPVSSYTNTAYVSQALMEAKLLFKLGTCRSTFPTDDDEEQLASFAILSLADSIYLASAYTTTVATPFQSETIGSYTYTKTSASVGSFATRIAAGQPTGDMWFDLAVRTLGQCELVSSRSLQVFTDDLMWEEDAATGRVRVLGPRDYNQLDIAFDGIVSAVHDPTGSWY